MATVPKKAQLKVFKQSAVLREKKMEETALSNDSDEESDVDMEANFALMTKNSRAGKDDDGDEGSSGEAEEWGEGSDEEEECGASSDEEEGEDGSDKEGEEHGESSDEEDQSSDEDHEVGAEEVVGGGNAHTEDVKQELSSMSFEDIQKLQQKVGLKAFNKMAHGSTDAPRPKNRGKKRLNKNRPIEVSSKRYVPFLRQVVPVKKSVRRDPRFDDLSGEYKPEIFEKTYGFISDIKSTEKEAVKKMLKTVRRSSKKEQLKSLVLRMENQERSRRSQELQREKEVAFKRRQKEQAALGLQPFYLNKGEQNKLQLAEKYEQLKKSGKLENFLTKKRKRNATKDRKKLPYQNFKQSPQ